MLNNTIYLTKAQCIKRSFLVNRSTDSTFHLLNFDCFHKMTSFIL